MFTSVSFCFFKLLSCIEATNFSKKYLTAQSLMFKQARYLVICDAILCIYAIQRQSRTFFQTYIWSQMFQIWYGHIAPWVELFFPHNDVQVEKQLFVGVNLQLHLMLSKTWSSLWLWISDTAAYYFGCAKWLPVPNTIKNVKKLKNVWRNLIGLLKNTNYYCYYQNLPVFSGGESDLCVPLKVEDWLTGGCTDTISWKCSWQDDRRHVMCF